MRFILILQMGVRVLSVVSLVSFCLLCENLKVIAQTCPLPLLDRLLSHSIKSDDTLVSIGQRYKVTPETIMGLNPQVRSGLPVGETIMIPPLNGIRVNVPPGMLIRDVAKQYKVRADVLFEVNGCQPAPSVLFIPGITWSPRYETRTIVPSSVLQFVSPLQVLGSVLTRFGVQRSGEMHSGVDLAAAIGSPVMAVADGTIAFSGVQGDFGNLVVINHAKGYQTRYAQLSTLKVRHGQKVQAGETIGTVGRTGRSNVQDPHLYFEVRSNTKLGWVAEDPLPWLGLK
jgi:murein DD-endopeptidase MepM/ murein hydrolase activator NlpD